MAKIQCTATAVTTAVFLCWISVFLHLLSIIHVPEYVCHIFEYCLFLWFKLLWICFNKNILTLFQQYNGMTVYMFMAF